MPGATPRRGRYSAKAPFDASGQSGSALVLAERMPLASEPYTRGGSPIRARGDARAHSPGYALVPAEVTPYPSAYTRSTAGSSSVAWEYKESNDVWKPFSDEEVSRLENSYVARAGSVELPAGKGGRLSTFNFDAMSQTLPNGDTRDIRRNEVLNKYLQRPKGFTEFSAQFVRRHNPKFNIHLEGFFGGTAEKGTISGSEAVCAEVLSNGHVWTGEKDGTIKIWNAKNGKRVATTEQKKDIYVSSLLEVPSTDGQTITMWVGFTDAVIRVFSTTHPYDVTLNLRRHGPGARVHTLVPQIGGHCVFSGGQDGQIFQWDSRTYECVNQFSGHRNGVRALIADADVLYSGSDDNTIAVWDIYGRDRVEWRGHTGGVQHLVKTDRHVWSGSEDETVRIWNPDTGECLCVLTEHSGRITAMNLIGDKVWTSAAGTIYMWSARDISTAPVAQYSSNHSGYITNMPVIHKSVLVRVWTTGKEGEIKVWDAECSADYDPEEVLRPQLDAKKQEVRYLKERLLEVEDEYKSHSAQQEARIEKLKDDVSGLQTELAEKIATLASTKQDLAQQRNKNDSLESKLLRYDDRMEELVRDLSIEKSKGAGIMASHQKEMLQVRKEGAQREDNFREESSKRIAKLEVQVTEANRELAKIEELQKTLDMMRISSGSVSANSKGDITSRVHALIEENQQQAARIAEMTKELERSENDIEKSRLARKQMEDDYHGSQRRVRDLEEERAQAVHDTEMAKLETNFQQDLSPAKTATALDGDEYGDDSGRNKELSRNLADARAKAQYLEHALEREKKLKEREQGQSLQDMVGRRDADEGSEHTGEDRTGDEEAFHQQRDTHELHVSDQAEGERPANDDDHNEWVYDKTTGRWTRAEEETDEMDANDLTNAAGEQIMPGLQVREDGLILFNGKPVQGTEGGSYVVQAKDGTLQDGSGKEIDVSITPDHELVAHVVHDDKAAEDELLSGSQKNQLREIVNQMSGLGVGTPDGKPCVLNEDGELVWNDRVVTHAGGRVTWREGQRPKDATGRSVVGVTEYATAIVLDEHNDPVVLPVGVNGEALKAHDGRHVVEPLGGRPMLEDGTLVMVGTDSRPIATNDGLVAISGNDGAIGPDGAVVKGPDGQTPVTVSERGTPIDADGPLHVLVLPDRTMRGVIQPGTPVSGHDGKVISDTTGLPCVVGADGKSVVGPDGHLALGPEGAPVVVGENGRPECPHGTPVNVFVNDDGRALVEGLSLDGQGSSFTNASQFAAAREARERQQQRDNAGISARDELQSDELRRKCRDLETEVADAHDQLDRALQDLDVERELSRSMREKVELLARDFGKGTRDEEMGLLQRELAELATQGARRDDDMVRRESEHKNQLEHELGRKLSLIEQERQEEVNKFRDMVERRDESLRIFSEKQRSMMSHIRQLEDNIHQANAEQAMIWEKHKNPSQLPTNELIYYYKYKEEQYAKIGGLNQQLHEENAALMGQTQALTEKLHAMSFVIESRPSLLKVLYDLYKMCVHSKKTIEKFAKEVSAKERTRRELLDNIGSIRTEVVDVMNGEKWLIANMFTEYELLHLGTSPSFFVPDGKRFSRYKPSNFSGATGTGRWTRTSVHNSAAVTPRGESPRPSQANSPQEFLAGRPASPQRAEYRDTSINRYY